VSSLLTVAEAARQLNRPVESVRKIVTLRGVEKFYMSGSSHRFRIRWDEIEAVYQEIAASGR
jgi:hypothetical protein